MVPTEMEPPFQNIHWGPEVLARVTHLRACMSLFSQPTPRRVSCSTRVCACKAQRQPRGGSLQGEGLEHKRAGGGSLACMEDPLWCGPASWFRRRKERWARTKGHLFLLSHIVGLNSRTVSLTFKPGLSGAHGGMFPEKVFYLPVLVYNFDVFRHVVCGPPLCSWLGPCTCSRWTGDPELTPSSTILKESS